MSLEQDIVLVTGASRGIGSAIADAMLSQGATVIGTATTDAGAAAIQARIDAASGRGAGMTLNVTDADQVAQVLSAITEQFGPVSVLVNNAGITRDNLLLRMKDSEWDDIIETNLGSIFRLCKLCVKPMIKARRGRIINIASVVGVTGNPGQANYAAAKAGMIGFAKSIARELGSRGVTVNTIAPGFIVSDMTDALPDSQKEALCKEIALGRLGAPEDIAQAAVFLASAGANYITGHTLHVNGGMYMN